MKSLRGDQDWMYKHIKDQTYWPDEWIMSYKWEMRDKRDLEINKTTRKRNFSVDAPPRINPDTCIAVFLRTQSRKQMTYGQNNTGVDK